MAKLFIAFNFQNEPISVLLAQNKEQADIAWAGMKESPHHVEEIDPANNNIGVHGLAFILTSTEANSRNFSHRVGGVDFRIWKRGL